MESKETKKRSFEALFQEYVDVVYRLCLYKTSNKEIANDLTQETFLRLWKSMSRGTNIPKPKQYIYQITRNLIVDYYKSKKSMSLDRLHEEGVQTASSDVSSDILAEAGILREAIDSLDDDYREVLYLRYVEEYSVKDIACTLGISENLASVRINRGKSQLRNIFI